jgi:hypothetical protein
MSISIERLSLPLSLVIYVGFLDIVEPAAAPDALTLLFALTA